MMRNWIYLFVGKLVNDRRNNNSSHLGLLCVNTFSILYQGIAQIEDYIVQGILAPMIELILPPVVMYQMLYRFPGKLMFER